MVATNPHHKSRVRPVFSLADTFICVPELGPGNVEAPTECIVPPPSIVTIVADTPESMPTTGGKKRGRPLGRVTLLRVMGRAAEEAAAVPTTRQEIAKAAAEERWSKHREERPRATGSSCRRSFLSQMVPVADAELTGLQIYGGLDAATNI